MLLLVKHSLPAIDPAVPPAEWPLSEEGKARCERLALRLREFDPAAVVSSTEPKAIETARALSVEVAFDERLREHDRSGVPWLGEAEFGRAVGAAFERPDEIVFGRESIAAARNRFAASVEDHRRHVSGTLVVVAHGTVIAAYAAAQAEVDGFALWRRLGLPSFVVLDGTQLIDVVEEI